MWRWFARALYWAPRVFALLFAGFVSLFALDVFDLGLSFWETVAGLVVHLLPTWLLLLALAVAWRRERAGGVLFILIALAFVIAFGENWNWMAFAGIALPPVLIGLLFLADAHYRERLKLRT